jgi:hypothetical protein
MGGEDVPGANARDAIHLPRHRKMLALRPQTSHPVGHHERRPLTHEVAQRDELVHRFERLAREVLAAGNQQVELAQCRDESRIECGQRKGLHLAIGGSRAKEALQDGRARRSPIETGDVLGRDLVGNWRNQHCAWRLARIEARQEDPAAALLEPQAPALERVAMDEGGGGVRRTGIEPDRQAAKLIKPGLCLGLGPGDCHHRNAHVPRLCGPGDVHDRPTRPRPAIGKAVDGQAADHEQIRPGDYHRAIMKLFFFELHEGATDLLTDAVLVTEQEYTPEAFASLVLAARAAVVDTFEEDTLVEAIARELERSHGFTYAADEKLTASMSVGMDEADTYLVETSDEFRSVIAEVDLSS